MKRILGTVVLFILLILTVAMLTRLDIANTALEPDKKSASVIR